jgi:glycogen debranching enzyme
MQTRQAWIERCSGVLKGNLPDRSVLEKLPYRYTCPAREKGTYLPQWLWDSCFHAIAYRWFDPGMAWEELQSLFVHQLDEGPDAGMVPHMSHLEENGAVAAQRLFGQRDCSTITQPPLISVAALAVHQRAPDRGILARLYPKLRAYHDWFDRRRDDDHDNLVAIIHPWESGWDASQRWDGLMGLHPRGAAGLRALEQRRKDLVALCAAQGYDAQRLAQVPGGFYVEPADFNAIRTADLMALAEIADELQEASEAEELEARARAVRQAVHDKMVSFENGELRAHDLLGAAEEKSSVDHAGTFVLMFGQCLSRAEADTISTRLLDPVGAFATPYKVASTSRFDPLFDPGEYWRGNVWLSLNWLVWRSLLAYGRADAAAVIVRDSLALVEKSGFCEFFNPLTGGPGEKYGRSCPEHQSWSTIILDMLQGTADE